MLVVGFHERNNGDVPLMELMGDSLQAKSAVCDVPEQEIGCDIRLRPRIPPAIEQQRVASGYQHGDEQQSTLPAEMR